MRPGDIMLVRTDHFVSKLIRFGQRSYGLPASEWNHVAIYVGNGEIVEALTAGVVLSPADKYPPSTTKLARTLTGSDCDAEMRKNATSFARSCVGQKYGWITIAAIALKTVSKGKLGFGVSGTSICSGLCARALERQGYNWNPYDPSELTPAYLAKQLS